MQLTIAAGFHLPSSTLPSSRSVRPRAAAATLPLGPSKVLYDGKCMVCLTNKAVLSFFDRRKDKLEFVNIRDPDYSPSSNGGVQFEDAMRHIHVITGDLVATGSEAVLQAYSKVGLGWLMAVLRFPLIRWIVDLAYAVVSKHRYTISRFLPGGKALASAVNAVKDMESAAMGEGCDDEEECMLPDYDDDDDDA